MAAIHQFILFGGITRRKEQKEQKQKTSKMLAARPPSARSRHTSENLKFKTLILIPALFALAPPTFGGFYRVYFK
jgi:hypothetical protein